MGVGHPHMGRFHRRRQGAEDVRRGEDEARCRPDAGIGDAGRPRLHRSRGDDPEERALAPVRRVPWERQVSGHRDGRTEQGRPGHGRHGAFPEGDRDAHRRDRPDPRLPLRRSGRSGYASDVQRQLLRHPRAEEQLPRGGFRHPAVRSPLRLEEDRIQRRTEAIGDRDGHSQGRRDPGGGRRGCGQAVEAVDPPRRPRRPGHPQGVQQGRHGQSGEDRGDDLREAGEGACRVRMATTAD